MAVEPSQFHTIYIRPVTASDKPRTVADYQADLIRRFGRLPSHEELARLEQGLSIAQRPYVPPKPDNPKTAAMRAAIVAKGIAAREDIMRVLTQPMTCPDVAYALKRSSKSINRHLVLLAQAGKITGRKTKGVVVWEAV